MVNPKISVIIPVYNAEVYLHRCVDSVLSQSFKDFELLLVDDGSVDSSADICDEYANGDERVRVFHKKNGGVSSARNLGLDNARGEWVVFVDADDWIVDNGFNVDYNILKEDLILFPYYIYEIKDAISYIPTECYVSETSDDLKVFFCRYLHEGFLRTVWSKFFKRELIDSLRFDESIPIGEDHLFLLNYLCRIKTYRFISNPFYVYRSLGFLYDKYQIDVEKSIYIMNSLFSAYYKLGVCNDKFEKEIFCEYKFFCQHAIDRMPQLWYGDKYVKSIYSKVKNKLRCSYRIRYILMSFCIFSKIRNWLK